MSALIESLSSYFIAGKFELLKAIQFIFQATVASIFITWIGQKSGIFKKKNTDIRFPEKGTGSNYPCTLVNKSNVQLQECKVKISITHELSDVLNKSDLNNPSVWDIDRKPYIHEKNLKVVNYETLPFSDDTKDKDPILTKNINVNDQSNFDVLDVKSEWNYVRIFSEKKYNPPRVYLKKKRYSGIIHVSAKDYKGKNIPIIIDPNNEEFPIAIKSSNILIKFRNWVCGIICKNSF